MLHKESSQSPPKEIEALYNEIRRTTKNDQSHIKHSLEVERRKTNTVNKSKMSDFDSNMQISDGVAIKISKKNKVMSEESSESQNNHQFQRTPIKKFTSVDYFNDKLLKFKLIKVKNKFAPIYKMNMKEGSELRNKIMIEAKNEMESIINKKTQTINRKGRNIDHSTPIKYNNESSSDNTLDGSSSLPHVSSTKKVQGKTKIMKFRQK
jgi:hypothetical protein